MTRKDKKEVKQLTDQIKIRMSRLRKIDDKDLNKKLTAAQINSTADEDKSNLNLYSALGKLDDAIAYLDKIK